LSERLKAAGAMCTVLPDGGALDSMAYDGVVYLSGLDCAVSDTMHGDAVHAAAVEGCTGALRLVQGLAGSSASTAPRLWVVTRGAQPIGAANDVVAPAQAPLWGLGSVIALEHPSLRCVRVDLDPLETADSLSALMAELGADGLEDRIAWRAGKRYVARLVRRAVSTTGSSLNAADQPLRLELSQPGVLESLAWQPAVLSSPGPGEVTIRVRATSLNFRDVLNALGMYPGDAGPLGDECAGTIVATGTGVQDYAAGDEVVALASGSFRTHVTTPQTFVVRRPAQLSLEAAVALPIAYLTALYGLRSLARLAPGDRVLIHAAAGGVGLAAVRIAQKAGAEIFATAGSHEKRAFLEAQGVPHVLDSRSLDFAAGVRARTGGRGVDVVLNSLSGEFIGASLGVLAPHGRFIEIGKREIWTKEQVAAAHPTAEYYPFHLGTLMETHPALVRSLMAEIMEDVAAGNLPQLPHREFEATDAVAAFRQMAQARHIGKIVVKQFSPVQIRSDRTYLITGGLGALGLRVAMWLVARGARHLVLMGRSGANATAQQRVRELEAAGAKIMVATADVTRREDLFEVAAAIENSMPPVGGVVHAAGVLDDGVLLHQDRSRLAHVMAPKVAGAWNLHALTRNQPLDFFVLFSSIVAIAGTAGQGNYAAANAFLDALAHYRRGLGLPALSINWGAWADTGMASQLSSRDQRRWTDQGIILIAPEQGVEAMAELLAQGPAQAGVLPIDWATFLRQFPRDAEPLLYAEIQRPSSTKPVTASPPALLQRLKETAPNQRRPLLAANVRGVVVRALGLDPAQTVDHQQPLSELGLDSLMAVEIRNALGIPLGRTLPVSLLYDYPTIEALTGYLAQQIPGFEQDTTPPADPPPSDGQAMATLQHATEAEAEALLLKELEALNF
jgi:NADPH:quinone reductase-like Zn-dependent oxidoreductase/acyl carrier protein